MNRVAVIETGVSNVDSVVRAVEEVGGSPYTARRGVELEEADRIVLPGVGSFDVAAELLRRDGLADAVVARAQGGVPLLGICLGMQLLATSGDEGRGAAGLALVPGHVRRMVPAGTSERIPHVGWNQVELLRPCALFDGIEPDTDFYFVHGYGFHVDDDTHRVATTPYCGGVTSVVGNGNVVGVQFHPEKSHRAGLRLLGNFLEM